MYPLFSVKKGVSCFILSLYHHHKALRCICICSVLIQKFVLIYSLTKWGEKFFLFSGHLNGPFRNFRASS